MRIVKQTSEALRIIETVPLTDLNFRMKKYEEAAKQIRAELNCPVELMRCSKINHDARRELYTATFEWTEKSMTLKISDEVMEFLASRLKEFGVWVGRIEKGVLVDACLLTLD